MDAQIVEATLKMHVKEVRERLDRAADVARAAKTCGARGNIEKAIEIALDVEHLICQVNAASITDRVSKT